MELCLNAKTDKVQSYIMYGGRQEVQNELNWYMNRFPNDYWWVVTGNGLKCMPVAGGGFAVGKYFDGAHKTQYYERLNNALKRLE